MQIEETVESLRAKYEDKGGIIAIDTGSAGIDIFFDPTKRDQVVLDAAAKDCSPFGVHLRETTITPDAAEKLAQEQIAADADLGCIFKEGEDVVYCFYLPGPDRAVNYILQDGKLVEKK